MKHFTCKFHCWRGEGIICGKFEHSRKDTTFIWCSFWPSTHKKLFLSIKNLKFNLVWFNTYAINASHSKNESSETGPIINYIYKPFLLKSWNWNILPAVIPSGALRVNSNDLISLSIQERMWIYIMFIHTCLCIRLITV